MWECNWRSLISGLLIAACAACTSPYEENLAHDRQWDKLGSYHGEQGYREWDEKELTRRGALSETDYEAYRAGYLKGRFEYCSEKHTVDTVINPGYPNDCREGKSSSSYGLVERGY